MTRHVPLVALLPTLLALGCKGGLFADDTGQDTGQGAYADDDEDGFQGIDGDCDDQDPSVFPGAAERAGDGVDNNCDGLDGSADSLQDEAVFTLTGEELRPSLGSQVAVVRDMDGDGHAELVMTQQLVGLENSAEELTEQVVIVHGPLDTTTTLEDAVRWSSESISFHNIADGGDMNGDGLSELIIAIPGYSEPETNAGRVWVLVGGATPLPGLYSLETLSDTISHDESFGRIGTALSGGGDLNGDGLADLLLTSPSQLLATPTTGLVLGFEGPITGAITTDDATFGLSGVDPGDLLGETIAWAGDMNGDGHDDMLTSAKASGEAGVGQVWLVHGPLSGALTVSDAEASLVGDAQTAFSFGSSLTAAGDTDGDGVDDVLISSQFYAADGERAGRSWLFLGGLSGAYSVTDAEATFLALGPGDLLGAATLRAGDINDDGLSDVLLSAPQQVSWGGDHLPRVSLFYGPFSGELTAEHADRVWSSAVNTDLAGVSMAVGGDLTGDGAADLAISAPRHPVDGRPVGRVYGVTLE